VENEQNCLGWVLRCHSWWLATEVMLEIYVATIETGDRGLRKNGGSQWQLQRRRRVEVHFTEKV